MNNLTGGNNLNNTNNVNHVNHTLAPRKQPWSNTRKNRGSDNNASVTTKNLIPLCKRQLSLNEFADPQYISSNKSRCSKFNLFKGESSFQIDMLSPLEIPMKTTDNKIEATAQSLLNSNHKTD